MPSHISRVVGKSREDTATVLTTGQRWESLRAGFWGDPDFTLGDAAQAAFLGSDCEELSRHHQLAGDNWKEAHLQIFWNEFVSIARACLWAEGGN